MLNRRHFLLFVFMLIPIPGATLTDYELAQRLLGQWSLTYIVPQFGKEPKSYLENYTLSEIREDSLHPGTYQVWGTNQFGEPVIARYDSETQEYRLAFAPNPTDPIRYSEYKYYTFTFSSAQTVTGCYHKPDTLTEHGDGSITPDYGQCASLLGTVQPLVIRPTQRPVARFTVTPPEGYGPLTIQLDATSSFDPDGGELVKYQWNIYTFFAGLLSCTESALTLFGPQVSFILPTRCSAEIELRVTDDEGFMSTARSDEGETPLNIRAFQSPHNQLPQVPGTPNYRLDLASLTLIVWRERQPDGTYFPFIRIIPKDTEPFFFIEGMNKMSTICGLSALPVEQNGIIYKSVKLKLSTQLDEEESFCDYLFEPATFFLAQSSIKKNFNDTQAFSLFMEKNYSKKERLEVPAVAEGQPPVAHFTMIQSPGYAPVTVNLDASTAFDPDGQIIQYEWDIEMMDQRLFGQHVTTEFEPLTKAFRGEVSSYDVTLTVVDNLGLEESNTQTIQVLEPPPPVSLVTSQSVYHHGEQLQIQMPTLNERASYSDNYVEYVGVVLPRGEIYSLTHQNLLVPFDGSALSPWQGKQQVVDLPITSEIPRGLYQLYLVLVPKGIEPLSFRQHWGRGITTFTILD